MDISKAALPDTGRYAISSVRQNLCQVPPAGLEPSDVTSSENKDLRQTPKQRAAKSAAVGDDLPPIDPELASVIEAWPTLSPAIREAVLAMLRAAE